MEHKKRIWYHRAAAIFTLLCAILMIFLVLGVWFCYRDYQAAQAAGTAYNLPYMLVQGIAVCGVPGMICGFFAVRFRNKG